MLNYASLIDPERLATARLKLSCWLDPDTRYSSSGVGIVILQSSAIVQKQPDLCNHSMIHGKSTWNKNSFGTLRCSKCHSIKAV